MMGNVGIGTNNPGFDLDVNGTIRLRNSGFVSWGGTCQNPGEIRFNGNQFFGCAFNASNVSTWQLL